MSEELKETRVAILATDGVEDSELREPRAALQNSGAQTTLFSPKQGKIYSMKHHDKAGEFDVDKPLDEADSTQFDAVLLPGGARNADTLRLHPRAQQFVRAMDEQGKTHCGNRPRAVAADLRRSHTWTDPDELSHDSR